MKIKNIILNKNTNTNSGFSLVEVIVSSSILLILVFIFSSTIINFRSQINNASNKDKAIYLAEEAIEATRNIRDEDYDNLTNGIFGISNSGGEFNLLGSSDSVGIFNRNVSISQISPNQKEVESSVSWSDRISPNNNVSLKTYLTNWRKFEIPAGLTINKIVINYFGSKVVDDFSPYEVSTEVTDNSQDPPSLTIITTPVELGVALSLSPAEYTVSENTDPNYTQTFSGDCDMDGLVILASGDAKSCTITNEEKYATLTINKTVVNDGWTKTISDFAPFMANTVTIQNGVATKFQEGSYNITETDNYDYTAFFSGDCNPSGAVSLSYGDNKTCNITNTQASWVNPNTRPALVDITGTQDGRKVKVLGNYAYIIMAGGTPDFLIIDISNESSPVVVGSLTLNGNPLNIAVSGDYAYVASDSNTEELQIINVVNKTAPVLTRGFDVPGTANANGIFVNGATVYLAEVSNGANGDFHIINVSNPASPIITRSVNTGNTSYDVVVSGNYAYIASSSNTQELIVINITNPATASIIGSYNASSNTNAIAINKIGSSVLLGQGSNMHVVNVTTPTSPSLYATYNAGGTVNDITVWDSYNRVFIATANTTNEMQVINITTPSTPSLIGGFNGLSTFNGITYNTTTNRVYVTATNNAGEFSIIKP